MNTIDFNRYLYHFGISVSAIFGLLFSVHYFSEGHVHLEELYTCIIGILLAIGAYLWRKFVLKKNM